MVGGIVFLAVRLARRGKTNSPGNLPIQQRAQPLSASAKSELKKLWLVEVRDGKVRVRWGRYSLMLAAIPAGSFLVNGCLLAVGVWSGMGTVLFGLFGSVILLNVWVIYEFNKAGAARPANGSPSSNTHARWVATTKKSCL